MEMEEFNTDTGIEETAETTEIEDDDDDNNKPPRYLQSDPSYKTIIFVNFLILLTEIITVIIYFSKYGVVFINTPDTDSIYLNMFNHFAFFFPQIFFHLLWAIVLFVKINQRLTENKIVGLFFVQHILSGICMYCYHVESIYPLFVSMYVYIIILGILFMLGLREMERMKYNDPKIVYSSRILLHNGTIHSIGCCLFNFFSLYGKLYEPKAIDELSIYIIERNNIYIIQFIIIYLLINLYLDVAYLNKNIVFNILPSATFTILYTNALIKTIIGYDWWLPFMIWIQILYMIIKIIVFWFYNYKYKYRCYAKPYTGMTKTTKRILNFKIKKEVIKQLERDYSF